MRLYPFSRRPKRRSPRVPTTRACSPTSFRSRHFTTPSSSSRAPSRSCLRPSDDAAWYLALLSMAHGDAMQAHRWLCSLGYGERVEVFPLFPMEIADDPQLVRIAAATADRELANRVIELARHRSKINPGIQSMKAIADHAAGIWHESVESLTSAVLGLECGSRPFGY